MLPRQLRQRVAKICRQFEYHPFASVLASKKCQSVIRPAIRVCTALAFNKLFSLRRCPIRSCPKNWMNRYSSISLRMIGDPLRRRLISRSGGLAVPIGRLMQIWLHSQPILIDHANHLKG